MALRVPSTDAKTNLPRLKSMTARLGRFVLSPSSPSSSSSSS